MNIFQNITRQIIKQSFYLSVSTIEKFHNIERCEMQVTELGNQKEDTLGHDIYKCLKDNNLGLVPNYESHDLKHVLLSFKMTPEDEIRMQAFMLGNGNWSLPCISILLFGAILLPDMWTIFWEDYKKGRKATPISSWTIEQYADKNTDELRQIIFTESIKKENSITMKKLSRYGAFASMIAGFFGMIFCFPFLWSARIEDLVGAGFPFVGGAILFGAGLIAFSIATKKQEFA